MRSGSGGGGCSGGARCRRCGRQHRHDVRRRCRERRARVFEIVGARRRSKIVVHQSVVVLVVVVVFVVVDAAAAAVGDRCAAAAAIGAAVAAASAAASVSEGRNASEINAKTMLASQTRLRLGGN